MKDAWLLAGALAVGAAGGLAAGLLRGAAPPAPAPGPGGETGSAPAPADLSRLESRVDELAAALRAREPGGAPAAPAGSGEEAPGAPAPQSPDDPASLPARLAVLEGKVAALEKGAARAGVPVPDDLSKVPSGELEGLARALTQERRYGDLLRVAEEWARRSDLTADQRVEADMNVGYALRGMAKHGEAEARFREALARVGEGSEKAPWLGFQIGWERSFQKDPAGASLEMEKAANHAAVSPVVRVHALLAAANFAKESGDTERARGFLDRLLGTYAGDIPASQAFIRQQAEALRKEITGN